MKIINKLSPNNSSRDNNTPDIIVCHQTAGDSIKSALNWFMQKISGVSSNYLVDKDGTIYCCVPIERMAWCNGNKVKDTEVNTSNYYKKSLNKIVRSRKINANKYTVSIEFVHKGFGDITELQKSSGLWLMKYIISEIKRIYKYDFIADRDHIIGHYEISPINKASCPGKDFPFDYFIRRLQPIEPPKPIELMVGDYADFNGVIYTDSYGNANSAKGHRIGSGYIERIFENRKAGYLIRNNGWFEESSLKRKKQYK